MQVCHFQHLLRQFDKNEPGRFLGEGVSFRAKLIGVLEVPEARGDRMCQEALADLKMAIRAAGEHKQRIQVHVAIDGLRLRDDKTGDSLYHHPVHKISFIAQDMTDSRAFGYIFGSPDTGHRFFGIKTDKAASQVVIAMRDLFQVVFELKKKEVEMAKQQLESKTVTSSLVRHTANASTETKTKSITTAGETSSSTSKVVDVGAEGGVAELVDLEQELSSLRRGLTQVEGLTPSNDPFGDSFTALPSQKGLLPPPPPGASTRGRSTPAAPASSRGVFSPGKATPALPFDLATVAAEFEPTPALVDNLNDTPELKNPPKKVLKDLVSTQSLISDILPVTTDTKIEHYGPATTMTSLSRHSGGSVAIVKPTQSALFTGNFFSSDPFAETDPFDNTDPFSDSFKDDPFTSMQEFPKSSGLRVDELKSKLSREVTVDKPEPVENGKSVFNGPLQVSLPPEPAPKSPRLQRQSTEGSTVRQRPQAHKLSTDNASPPPPLPPKKIADLPISRPPPRPPHDHDDDVGPPLPKPAMRREPLADRSMKPRLSSAATNSSEDEYLTPAPPPLPTARRFDITLSQLLTCTMDELAHRLRVPTATLSSMTLPQLTDYLRSYLAADNDRAHIHVEPITKTEKEKPLPGVTALSGLSTPSGILDKPEKKIQTNEFKPQFEDNFTPPADISDTFVANFDDFDKKANPSYDRYAAFREIQEEELKAKSILDPIDALESEPKQDSDEKELTAIDNLIRANQERDIDNKETARSPLKTLDELTLDSFNMFRNSVSPKPSQIDAKIEDIKSVMKTLQIEKSRRSVSPRDNGHVDVKHEDTNDSTYSNPSRYAALREITITEPPQDEFESLPPELPKERKRSDEKSDGFDNSDFFDCIDNSSLSFTHVEDAFRKSPIVKDRERDRGEEKKIEKELREEKKEPIVEIVPLPVRDLAPPTRLSTGSISDVVSGSSPDTKEKIGGVVVGGTVCTGVVGTVAGGALGSRWAVLGAPRASAGSSDSRDSEPRVRVRRARHHDPPPRAPIGGTVCTGVVGTVAGGALGSRWAVLGAPRASAGSSDSRDSEPRVRVRRARHHDPPPRAPIVQTSSSSRDVSPWDEELPPVTRLQRPPSHRDRESRHNSSGSRECLDSGSGREKDKLRDKRDMRDRERDMSRDGRDSARDRRDSARDSGSGRDRRDVSKERDHRDRRDRRSRDRENDSWDRDRTYSREREYRDSRSRERLPKDYREKDRDRHRKPRHSYDEDEDYSDGCGSGRSSPRDRWPEQRWRRDERNYGSLGWRETRRRAELRQSEDSGERRYGSTLGWSSRRAAPRRSSSRERDGRRRVRRDDSRRPRDYRFSNDFSPRERDHAEPFDNDFHDTPTPTTKKRAPYASLEGTRFAFEPEDATASPVSVSSAREQSAARFRFDSDSVSPRSMFEDDFAAAPRPRTASIAEEEEGELPPLRPRPPPTTTRDIRKSDSINIFTRESDPFEGDAFFACTGSDRAARRENWPGDFQGFDNA